MVPVSTAVTSYTTPQCRVFDLAEASRQPVTIGQPQLSVLVSRVCLMQPAHLVPVVSKPVTYHPNWFLWDLVESAPFDV